MNQDLETHAIYEEWSRRHLDLWSRRDAEVEEAEEAFEKEFWSESAVDDSDDAEQEPTEEEIAAFDERWNQYQRELSQKSDSIQAPFKEVESAGGDPEDVEHEPVEETSAFDERWKQYRRELRQKYRPIRARFKEAERLLDAEMEERLTRLKPAVAPPRSQIRANETGEPLTRIQATTGFVTWLLIAPAVWAFLPWATLTLPVTIVWVLLLIGWSIGMVRGLLLALNDLASTKR